MKLVVLDCEGVICELREDGLSCPDDFVPLPGSLAAIARLTQAGYRLAVASNQSRLARGLIDIDTLHLIHKHLHEQVNAAGGRIDVIAVCPHGENDDCECRKPNPGLLYEIGERLNIDLEQAYLVGDSLKDMQAAMAAAMQPVLVKSGNGASTLERHKGLEQVRVHEDLAEFAADLLAPSENTAS